MKSFRDVLNGRMRTGKGRFVLASKFGQFIRTSVTSVSRSTGSQYYRRTEKYGKTSAIKARRTSV